MNVDGHELTDLERLQLIAQLERELHAPNPNYPAPPSTTDPCRLLDAVLRAPTEWRWLTVADRMARVRWLDVLEAELQRARNDIMELYRGRIDNGQ